MNLDGMVTLRSNKGFNSKQDCQKFKAINMPTLFRDGPSTASLIGPANSPPADVRCVCSNINYVMWLANINTIMPLC